MAQALPLHVYLYGISLAQRGGALTGGNWLRNVAVLKVSAFNISMSIGSHLQ